MNTFIRFSYHMGQTKLLLTQITLFVLLSTAVKPQNKYILFILWLNSRYYFYDKIDVEKQSRRLD